MKKFRNSLFGFNNDDVMGFVFEAKENEARLKKNIRELEAKAEADAQMISELEATVKQLTSLLDDFKQREAAITALSESIGRLYLVAQANASAIITAANENAEAARSVVEQNVSVADNAEEDLNEIGRVLLAKTREYSEELEALKAKLYDTKQKIAENTAEIDKLKDESSAVTTGVSQ